LEANDCFLSAPGGSADGGIPGGNEEIRAIAGDAAGSPYPGLVRRRGPIHYIGRIVNLHANYASVIIAGVTKISAVWNINYRAHEAECSSFALNG
jgi:hypothetical protein